MIDRRVEATNRSARPDDDSILLLRPSLVAAVYGMNFDHMPELHWRIGYPFSLALMAAAGLVLHRAFKRRNWL